MSAEKPARALRIGVWTAVSSRAQAEPDQISLEEQESLGREFAAAHGELRRIYRVSGFSRDYVLWSEAEEAVPEYGALRRDLEERQLDVLWCYSADRLGRHTAIIQQVYGLGERYGCEVFNHSAPHPLGQLTTGQRIASSVMAHLAEEDQMLRVRRHKMGMRGRIQKKGLIPGIPPHGYSPLREPESGKVIGYEFDDGIAAVDRATTLFLEGQTYAQIAERLNTGPYPTPSGTAAWDGRAVWRLMYNETYAGLPHWADYAAEEPSDRFPALWDAERHAAIIRERRRRAVRAYRRGAGPYSGVAFCRRCGAAMSRINRPYKSINHYYYRCATHTRASTHGTCHYNHIATHKITAEVADFLAWLATEENLDAALATWREGREAEALRADTQREKALLEDLRQQRQRLGLAYAAGKMDVDLYRTLDDQLLGRLEAAQGRADEARRALEALPDLVARREILQRLSEQFPFLVEQEAPVTMAALLQTAGLVILVEEGEVEEIILG